MQNIKSHEEAFYFKLQRYLDSIGDEANSLEIWKNIITDNSSEFNNELMMSIINNIDSKVLELILQYVPDLNLNDLLCKAVLGSNISTTRMLLELGADPNSKVPNDLYHSDDTLASNLYLKDIYYDRYGLKGYLLFHVVYNLHYELLQLLVTHHINLGINDDMALRVLSEAIGSKPPDKTAKRFKKMFDLITQNHEFSPQSLTNTYINSIKVGNTICAAMLKSYILPNYDKEIISEIFKGGICFYRFDTILFCLDNLNFSKSPGELDTIVRSLTMHPSSEEIIVLMQKLVACGADLNAHAVELMLYGLREENNEFIGKLRSHINIEKCIRDIVGKIME